MIVYGEYLFAENFIAGWVILWLTSLMCGLKPGKVRITAGALMCGIFSFVLFLSVPKLLQVAAEIIFALMIASGVFRPGTFKGVMKTAAVFWCISVLIGGAAIAFIYMTGVKGTIFNGIFYIGEGGTILIMLGAVSGAAMVYSVVRFVRRRTPRGIELMRLHIEIMGKSIECIGKVDSANYLREPVSGKPVSLIEKNAAENMMGDFLNNAVWENRIRVVPFQSVGCENGMMTAVRCDSITIDKGEVFGRGKIYLRNAFIGIYDGKFSRGEDEEAFSVLLQPEMISEGGAVL